MLPSAFKRLHQSFVGDMPVDYARRVLAVDFTPEEVAWHRELAEKSQLGALTQDESLELNDLLTANDLLIMLHAKVQLSLKQASAVSVTKMPSTNLSR
jgi:hypothetical protein